MTYIATLNTHAQTNAAIKAWVQRFLTGAATANWEQLPDAGQIDPETITADTPTTAITYGYALFRLNDSMRTTDPVFMRAEFQNFGIGGAGANASYWGPQINLTFGFTCDGVAILGPSLSTGVVKQGDGYPLSFKPGLDVFAGGEGWATIAHGLGFAYYANTFFARQICTALVTRVRDRQGVVVPGELFVVSPEAGRTSRCESDDTSPYSTYIASGSRDGTTVRLLGHHLSKYGIPASGLTCAPGIVGNAATTATVNGVVQAQPVWMAKPQITPATHVIMVPTSAFSVGQVFTASIDGVNEHQYVCLGAPKPKDMTPGAMYAIDSFAERQFCFAVRVA